MGNPAGTRGRWAWCFFQCDGRPHAVRLDAVAEVVEADALVRVPLAPPRLLGLFALRRAVIPVLRMDGGRADPGLEGEGKTVVLVLRAGGGVMGIRVDRGTAVGVEELPIDPDAPPLGAQGPAGPRSIERGETTHAVLDPVSAWREAREAIGGWYAPPGGRGAGLGEGAQGGEADGMALPTQGPEFTGARR